MSVEAEKKNDISKPVSVVATTSNTPNTSNNSQIQQQVPASEKTVIPNTVVNSTTGTSSNNPAFKKTLLKTSTPSISQRFNTEKKAEETEVREVTLNPTERPKQAVSQEILDTVWQRYANDLKAKGKQNLAIVLTSRQPTLGSDSLTIEYIINNKAAEEALNEDKTTFLSFLRKELNNYSVSLNIIVAQVEEGKNLYTATDRYKHLSEKNPAINKLRQAFDLDIEF